MRRFDVKMSRCESRSLKLASAPRRNDDSHTVSVVKYTRSPYEKRALKVTPSFLNRLTNYGDSWYLHHTVKPLISCRLSPDTNNSNMLVFRTSEVPATMLILGVTSGFRRDVDEICVYLDYNIAYSGNSLPTFRDKRAKKIRFLDT